MGHAYLDLLQRAQLDQCAKGIGLDLDTLETLKRTVFAVKPKDEDIEGTLYFCMVSVNLSSAKGFTRTSRATRVLLLVTVSTPWGDCILVFDA